MKENLIKIMSKFKEKKVLVVGDIILDKYVFGDVSRVSPEAPIPLVDVGWENYVPGGAANAANNLASLGVKVSIIGVIGEDTHAEILLNKLNSRKIRTDLLIKDANRRTILKERVVANNQQLLRIDYDVKDTINEEIEEEAIKKIKQIVPEIDSVIVSDYGKGLINKKVMDELIRLCKDKNKYLVVDPKPENKELYKGVNLITPNYEEASQMAEVFGKEEDNINKVGNKLREKFDSDLLITRGPRGMILFSDEVKHFPTKAREVYDVSGAGDTVISILTLALSSGANMEEAITLANYAAGIVVNKFGTSTATTIEIEKSMKNDK